MLEITQEDHENVEELMMKVKTMTNCSSDALAPMVWQELRAAHGANKSFRLQQEMQQKAKEMGNAAVGPMGGGYYG